MSLYANVSIIITLAVFISYFNYRWVKMQPTIAVMATSLLLSVCLLVLDHMGYHGIRNDVTQFVHHIHFHDIVLNGMLGLLLFAGSFTLDLPHLKQQKWEIISLAMGSLFISTLFIGVATHFLLHFLGFHLRLVYCLLFGALISPTDPIAVLSTFKNSKAPKQLSMIVAAESLFNDGLGVVLFLTLYQVGFLGAHASFLTVGLLFFQKTVGGIGFGIILSVIAYALMHPVNDHKIEILLTIALVTGGYNLAQAIGVSGPLAMVTIGIYIANNKRDIIYSKQTREHLESFWALVDELLNSILFLLIGAEILLVHFAPHQLIFSFLAIPIVLVARYITVVIPVFIFKQKKHYPPYTVRILTWGGLRGGLAVALALAIPSDSIRNILLPMTYMVVLFSILVQGTTVKWLVKRSQPTQSPPSLQSLPARTHETSS